MIFLVSAKVVVKKTKMNYIISSPRHSIWKMEKHMTPIRWSGNSSLRVPLAIGDIFVRAVEITINTEGVTETTDC
jgi:hypothetical protein